MVRTEITNLLHEIGKIFKSVAKSEAFKPGQLAIHEIEFEAFEDVVQRLEFNNPWFTVNNTRQALGGIALWLEKELLEAWVSEYPVPKTVKRVAIIMAGNIPLVGFHDFLSVIMSGNHAVCKLSSQDAPLWQAVLQLMKNIDPRVTEHITVVSGKLADFDAVIATGSNNTAISFRHYFDKYPHIIRQNRTSLAVLNGAETDEELQKLADDIFSYFGFGCRNVTQLFIPQDFDIQRLFVNFTAYNHYININKYMNNFDYYRALYLMNGEELLENGFVLMRFNQSLHAAPAVINCHRYLTVNEVDKFIDAKKEEIQAVVGQGYIPFGAAQCPGLSDYADGVDVMTFLSQLD
jgi:hypothetical protein